MAETFRQTLSKEQLDNGIIPGNTVLVEMVHSMEGIKSKGGIIVGFNTDVEYEDESDSHAANMTEVYAKVVKCPQKLYYNRKDHSNTMPWYCDMDLMVGDIVYFNIIESKNAVEIVCEDRLYKLIPYQDLYCAKRYHDKQSWDSEKYLIGTDPWWEVIMLNGYVLLEPIYKKNISALAVSEQGEVDKTKGIVRYAGKSNKEYLRKEYIDFQDLEIGDEVLLSPGTPLFLLERKAFLAQFDGDNLYWVVQRRRISMVLSKNN